MRARGFDYRNPGPYHVTMCTQLRRRLFGDVANGQMMLNAAGEMVDRTWRELPSKFPDVQLASHVVMPNHVHGLLILRHEPRLEREATQGLPYDRRRTEGPGQAPGVPYEDGALTLSKVVGWFKTMSTNWYMHGVRDAGWPPFDRVLWQRSFHDRIVRNDAEMERVGTYIANNPALWEDDTFYV